MQVLGGLDVFYGFCCQSQTVLKSLQYIKANIWGRCFDNLLGLIH